MHIDYQNLFDQNVAHLTTEASTNVVDLGGAFNLGVGEDLYFVIVVTTAFTDAGSDSTMAITLETDNDEAFGSATAPAQTIGTFAALSAAGSRLVAKLQPDAINERYLRVKYTVANGDLSTGKFTAFLTRNIQAYTPYADAITIS